MKNKFLGIPYIIWMAIFVVIPLFLILGYALTTRDGGFTLSNFARLGSYAGVFADSFLLAIIATVICLIIGYPIAYWMSREGPAFKRIALVILMLPMWMNFLLRTYAWMSLLENTGILNELFNALGIFKLINAIFGTDITYFPMINTKGAVVVGMVYNYLPFMIMPIYTVIDKIDSRVIEAAQDLGASPVRVFFDIILPLVAPAIASGMLLAFAMSMDDVIISVFVTGVDTNTLPVKIYTQLKTGVTPEINALCTLLFLATLLLCGLAALLGRTPKKRDTRKDVTEP